MGCEFLTQRRRVLSRVEHVDHVDRGVESWGVVSWWVLTQRLRDAEYLNRVEHVERVEDGEVGFQRRDAETQRRRDGMKRVEHVDHVEDLEMGFHPIPRMRTNHL